MKIGGQVRDIMLHLHTEFEANRTGRSRDMGVFVESTKTKLRTRVYQGRWIRILMKIGGQVWDIMLDLTTKFGENRTVGSEVMGVLTVPQLSVRIMDLMNF